MHITFFSKDAKPEPWVNALRQHLPEAHVDAWLPAQPADYAVVWAPPQDFLDAQPGSRASSISVRGWTP